MHYDTTLQPKQNPKPSDVLSPSTAYKAYIFNTDTKELLETLPFTTHENLTGDKVEADGPYFIGSFPGGDITVSDPKNTPGHHTLHFTTGETVLLPFIVNANVRNPLHTGVASGIKILRPNSRKFEEVIVCNTTSTDCFTRTSKLGYYFSPPQKIEKAGNTAVYYVYLIFKIDAFNINVRKKTDANGNTITTHIEPDKGEWYIVDVVNGAILPNTNVTVTLTTD